MMAILRRFLRFCWLEDSLEIDDSRHCDGTTPLMTACTKGDNLARVRCLIGHGANANLRNIAGNTALDVAVMAGAVEAAKYLREMPIGIFELSDFDLGYIFSWLPPRGVCNARLVCKRFNHIGSSVFSTSEYWTLHEIHKEVFFSLLKTEKRFRKGMAEWLGGHPISMEARSMTMGRDYDHLLKVLMVGSPHVGKTTFMNVFEGEEFSESYLSTIGVDFKIARRPHRGKLIKLQIWDTSGREGHQHRRISTMYKGPDGVMIFYDVSDASTWKEVPEFLTDVRICHRETTKVVIVGCKGDLTLSVNQDEVEKFCIENKLAHVMSSNKTGMNVQLAFKILCDLILAESPSEQQHQLQRLSVRSSTITGCFLM